MGIQSAFFMTAFAVLIVAAIFNPFWGILAYMGHYYIWPEKQWWGELLASSGLRVSLTISVVTGASVIIHWSKLKRKIVGSVFHSQEILFWSYIAVIALAEVWGHPADPFYMPSIHPLDKMFKIGIFSFMLTHVVTTRAEINKFLWFVLTVGGLYLGYLAHILPASHFVKGRLEGVGGPDFSDSNFAACHFVEMGIVGTVLLLKTRSWLGRFYCLFAGAFIANGLILTRSRGAFLGVMAAGAVGVVLVDRSIRKHVIWVVPLVAVGMYSLTDNSFWERIFTTFVAPEHLDESAESRIEFWKAATQIFADNPLGVGPGRFYQTIGDYRPEYAGRDTHSLYFRTLAELGLPGIIVLFSLIGNAFRVLRRCQKVALNQLHDPDLVSIAIGFQLMLVCFVTCGLTMTMTYSEEFFLVLLLPACLDRAVSHALANQLVAPLGGPIRFAPAGEYAPSGFGMEQPAGMRV